MHTILVFFTNTRRAWKELWMSNLFKVQLLFTLLIFAIVVRYSCICLGAWEFRKGMVIIDPLLSRLSPRDFSKEIFLLIQTALFISFFLLWEHPKMMIKAFQAATMIFILRTLTVFYVPLETPQGMIYLEDAFTSFFLNSSHPVTKDLFFSGHIANMVLFLYYAQKKYWKYYLMLVTPIIAVLILWQHVHYTTDVIAAPFFALFSCKLVDAFNARWEYGIDKIEYPEFFTTPQ